MYAVIMSGGKQYRVAEGEVVRVEKLEVDPGAPVEFKDVLLVKTEAKTYIGQPLVQGASVLGTLEAQDKDDTVLVFKYKRKSNIAAHAGIASSIRKSVSRRSMWQVKRLRYGT